MFVLTILVLFAPDLADLGHDDFARREAATRQLVRLGPLALAVLPSDPARVCDPEARRRVVQIRQEIARAALLREAAGLLDDPGNGLRGADLDPDVDARLRDHAIDRPDLLSALRDVALARKLIDPREMNPADVEWADRGCCGDATANWVRTMRYRQRKLPDPE